MGNIVLLFYVLATSSALVLLKLGTNSGAPISYANNKLQFNINLLTMAGIFLYGTSFLLYTYLISKFELGYIISLATAFVYIIIFIASYFIFNEAFTVPKVLGIVLILGGLILLNVSK